MVTAQNMTVVSGTVLSHQGKTPLANVIVFVEKSQISSQTNDDGVFNISVPSDGDCILNVSLADYVVKRIPISLEKSPLNLGTIYLERDIVAEQAENLITLTDSEILDDAIDSNSSGLLQATRDVFLNRAAFDFGQAFFRVRGYDSQNGKILVNGIPMNKFYDGRPQWNNWGGLNDATKNQQFSHGLQPSDYSFGGILGTTNIDTRPTGLRPGLRLSSSASNRTYGGRLMVTYTSGLQKNGFAYSVSASRRWAKEGYIDGTLYDAFSVFGALEYRGNKKNTINFTGIFSSNRRGRSSALTEEVFELVGKRYNPYWGEQNGKIRNSRERKIAEPILMLNHFYKSDKFNLNTGISYQFGTNTKSRLGYYNAPNPDPTYYRYLPSFYTNSPIGANFISANLTKEGFVENPQLNWNQVYQANADDKAVYVLYDDVVNDKQFIANTIGNLKINETLKIDFGLTYKKLVSNNHAKIIDLLGADFHEDIDPFSNTLNDIRGASSRVEKEIFNYQYDLYASQFDAFAQFKYNSDKWDAFISGNFSSTNYQRNGRFQNERFLENSYGKSERVTFSDYGLKSGFTYKINGRHWITAHGAYLTKPPILQNIFINPRENNQVVTNIQNEKVNSTDINYYLRLPKLTGRITGFRTSFQDATDINFFFVDSGVGSDFVQEVVTGLNKLHMGAEVGLEYQLSSAVKLTAVAAIGKYVYANDPSVSINFDTAGAEEDLIDPRGTIDLGIANIKDYKLAQGPQRAFSLGINYRDPKYWWVGATANYMANNYANISTITRTQSFYLDPETGQPFPNATEENVNNLLAQKPLDDFYLLNMVGGKSWLKNGRYISIFVSVNNVFDAVFRTGGYEQSRNGNFGQLQQDNLSGTPSFAPKYWYGYGRTYFLNLAISF
ncbi:Thiamin-regulated outer membrane receptor Omr1 [hydrothermal vent metagenome]|uniref:Thiamin-regulated outer membrane receptor Omr1 n=1 Tax=hydrothermal vent metagenome TaxID=652676 RepID=A0A3B0UEC4_9ZZZZ